MPPRSNAEKQAIFNEKCETLGDWMVSNIPNFVETKAVPESLLRSLQSSAVAFGLIYPQEVIRALADLGWDSTYNDAVLLMVTRVPKSNANYQVGGRARVYQTRFGRDPKKGSE